MGAFALRVLLRVRPEIDVVRFWCRDSFSPYFGSSPSIGPRMPCGKAAASAVPDVNGITNMTAESRGSFPAIMLAPPECPITQITTRGICPGGCRVLKVTGPW
jgi:hypothetical protein